MLRKPVLLLLIFAAITVALMILAPRFLLYSSAYEKADAIVLFLGPDFSLRQKQAYKLISENNADYLIIPAYKKTLKINKGNIKSLSRDFSLGNVNKKNSSTFNRPRYYEDTHLEVLEARTVMADKGLKSAIFVSSPYHMRRISYIVRKVFSDEKASFYFVPTDFEKAPADFWELSLADWRKVGREYGKIIWFFIYASWAD